MPATRLIRASRFSADARIAARHASSTTFRSGSSVVQPTSSGAACFGVGARLVSVPAGALSCLTPFAVVDKARIVVQQRIAGGQDGEGAERQQLAMTSIA